MWNEILGALAVVAMVYLCANASEVIAAVCDRIRYGIQAVDDPDPASEVPTTTTTAAVKPVSAKPAA